MLIFFSILKSEEDFKIEANLGYNFFINNGNFNNFKGLIDCGQYSNGGGNGLSYGIGAKYRIDENISIEIPLNLINASLNMNHINSFYSRDLITNQVVTATAQTNLDSKITFLNISPSFNYRISQNLIQSNLFVKFSPYILLPINGSFVQSESIVSPNNAVFIDNNGLKSQFRNITNSDFSTLQTIFGVGLGFQNIIVLDKNFCFTQEIGYNKSFNNLLSDANWKIDFIRIKLGVEYKFTKSEKIIEPIIEKKVLKVDSIIQEIVVKKEIPKIEPKYIKIKEAKFKELKYTELVTLKSKIPIYNLFFESKTDKLLDTNDNGKNFYSNNQILGNIKDLEFSRTTNTNYLITIFLNKNDKYSEELFAKRSQKIRNLFDKFNITTQSIIFKSDFLKTVAEEIENANKVDIVFDQDNFFSENITNRNVSGVLELDLEKNTQSSIFINSDFTNYIETGNRNHIEIPFNIKNRILNNTHKIIIKSEDSLEYTYTIDDLSNAIKIKEIDIINYELILLFDFNSSELSIQNKQILEQFSKIVQGKELEILGSTDNTGDAKINGELSLLRAKVVGDCFKSFNLNIKTSLKTIEDKYPENFPQGKILNRSVKIKVIK